MSQQSKRLTMLYASFAEPAQATTWRPAADVYRTQDGWLLKFEAAGLRLDDVTVSAVGSAVTVAGVRRDHMVEEGCLQYSMEISYSRFERTVHLPCSVESAKLDVQYINGILLVRVSIFEEEA